MSTTRRFGLQQALLVVLRTLIGWHFLYEGYTKLLHPAWSQTGAPLPAWSSAGYLKAATGPLASLFHWMGSSSWIGTFDLAMAIALTVLGLSLMLGSFTQIGCTGAIVLLATFYLSAVPLAETDARGEGTYLLVNKNLIEACAVALVWTFRTGSIAGLDRLRITASGHQVSAQEATV